MQLQDNFKTIITISCKDGTTRVIKAIGRWNSQSAAALGKDLEGDNFKSVQTDNK